MGDIPKAFNTLRGKKDSKNKNKRINHQKSLFSLSLFHLFLNNQLIVWCKISLLCWYWQICLKIDGEFEQLFHSFDH